MGRSSKPRTLRRFFKTLFPCCINDKLPPLNPSWSYSYPYRNATLDVYPEESKHLNDASLIHTPFLNGHANGAIKRLKDSEFSLPAPPFSAPTILPFPLPPLLPPTSAVSFLTSPSRSKEPFDQLSNIPPDSYHWRTQLGELIFTPHPEAKAKFASLGSPRSPAAGLLPVSYAHQAHSPQDVKPQLSPWLSINPEYGPSLHEWDITSSPMSSFQVLDKETFQRALSSPATKPESTQLSVHFDTLMTLDFPWPYELILNILKEDPIRVGDVLYAVHDYFRVQMTQAEVELIKMMGGEYYRILYESFQRRVSRQPNAVLQRQEFVGGFRRIDCLGAVTMFSGMWTTMGSRVCLGLTG